MRLLYLSQAAPGISDDQVQSRIIQISPADEPMFKDWSMAVIESNPLEFQYIADLRTHRMEAVHAKAFGDAMREFVDQLNAQRVSA